MNIFKLDEKNLALSALFAALCFGFFLMSGKKRSIGCSFISMVLGIGGLTAMSYIFPFFGEDIKINFFTVILSLSFGLPGAVVSGAAGLIL